MSPRTAIWEGLRDSFRFGGTMRRAPYLWFFAAASCALALTLALAVQLFPGTTGQVVLGVTALFYVPVTSAGMRRLRDAGFQGRLMVRPLVPVLSAALLLWLAFSAVTLRGLVWASVFVAPGLLVVAGLPVALLVTVATLVAFADVAGRLLLPSGAHQGSKGGGR